MYKRGLIVLTILLLCLSVASAANLDITHEVIKDRITLDEEAKIRINITNDVDGDNFRFSLNNFKWSLFTEDIKVKNTGLYIERGLTKSAVFIFKPGPEAPGGANVITLVIKGDNTDYEQTYDVPIYLNKEGHGGYVADVKTSAYIPPEIDPRNEFSVMVDLENRNKKDISNLTIKLFSSTFEAAQVTTLGPLEKKTEAIKIKLDPVTAPTSDSLDITVTVDDVSVKADKRDFEIIDYTGDYTPSTTTTESFLKTEKTTIFTNNGNNKIIQKAKLETTLLASLFTDAEPDRTSSEVIDGKRYLTWEIELAPGETFEAQTTTSYRIPVAIIIILLLIWIYIEATKAPLSITKKAEHIISKEGGIAEVKISLLLKNESKTTVENIEVRDIIPNIVNIEKLDQVGSLTPDKTFKNAKGNTVMLWDIKFVDPHEERIITYKLKSKLSILGDFKLPVAIVKYHDKKGKELFVKSRELSIRASSEQAE